MRLVKLFDAVAEVDVYVQPDLVRQVRSNYDDIASTLVYFDLKDTIVVRGDIGEVVRKLDAERP